MRSSAFLITAWYAKGDLGFGLIFEGEQGTTGDVSPYRKSIRQIAYCQIFQRSAKPLPVFFAWNSTVLRIAFVASIELVTLTLSAAEASPSPSASPNALSDVSSSFLSSRVQQLESDLQGIKEVPDQIRGLIGTTNDAITKVKDYNPEADLKRRVEDLKTALKNLSAYTVDSGQDLDALILNFSNALGDLDEISSSDLNQLLSNLGEAAAAIAAGYHSTALTSIGERLKQNHIDISTNKIAEELPGLTSLVSKLRDKHYVDFSKPPFSGIAQEIDNSLLVLLRDQVNKAKEKSGQTLSDAQSVLTAELTKVQQRISAETAELDSDNKELRSRELGQASLVSGNLIWIFIGIVVTIIAVLLILRVNSDDQSLLMIRERTAFELFATGMFLVTVIVLATGNLVEKTVLGTLLGTLAGYLFTRRGSSAPTTSDQKAPERRRPKKPSFEQTDGKIRVPTLEKDTDYYEIYARDATKPTGSATVIGLSSEQEFEIPASVKRGITYQVWIVGKNVTGESPPSESILVKL